MVFVHTRTYFTIFYNIQYSVFYDRQITRYILGRLLQKNIIQDLILLLTEIVTYIQVKFQQNKNTCWRCTKTADICLCMYHHYGIHKYVKNSQPMLYVLENYSKKLIPAALFYYWTTRKSNKRHKYTADSPPIGTKCFAFNYITHNARIS